MVDGTSLLMTFLHDQRHAGLWSGERASNYIDTAAPYYDAYETSDGQYMAVGAIEPQFWTELLRGLELDPASLPDQEDRSAWPAVKKLFADPHMAARSAMIGVGDRVLPAPAPRFSRSRPSAPTSPPRPGQHTTQVLTDAGFSSAEIGTLRSDGAVAGS